MGKKLRRKFHKLCTQQAVNTSIQEVTQCKINRNFRIKTVDTTIAYSKVCNQKQEQEKIKTVNNVTPNVRGKLY